MDGNNNATGTMVDLFCGCGGFTLGGELAGFRSLAAIDVDPTLQSGYRRNFPRSRSVQASVADLDRADWSQLIGRTRPDVLVGGPPCQGFSRIGKRREDDPRNTLVHHFYRHVNMLRPKVFVMENVEGILDAGPAEILAAAIETVVPRYTVLAPLTVNAAHFGAATTRRRIVVIGYDRFEVDDITAELLQPDPIRKLPTVRDAIADLPPLQPGIKDDEDFGWGRYGCGEEEAGPYARSLRRGPAARRGMAGGGGTAGERVRLGHAGYRATMRKSSSATCRRRQERAIPSPNRSAWAGRANARPCGPEPGATRALSRLSGRCIPARAGSSRFAKRHECRHFRIGSCSIQPSGTVSA